MNTKLATTQIRLNEWASIIKDCKSSGLKVDEYCLHWKPDLFPQQTLPLK